MIGMVRVHAVLAMFCLAAVGCGRIGFDPQSEVAASCLDDNFASGSSGWTTFDTTWSVDPTGGPDGSPAFTDISGGSSIALAPGLAAITFVDLRIDFLIADAATGDFNIFLEPAGKRPDVDPEPYYLIGMHPAGSDSAFDLISGANNNIFAQQPASLSAQTWYQLELVRHEDGSIDVDLGGAPYLQSPADDAIPAPLDVFIGFYRGGTIDNVQATCAR
jgi:hypothetical protein